MEYDRKREIAEAIHRHARADGTPVGVRHACAACAEFLNAMGAGVYLVSDLGLIEPVHATDPVGERMAELQITLGRGPSTQAVDEYQPILAADLDTESCRRHWPMFATEAMASGVQSIFAFPLGREMSGIAVGALEVYRDTTGPLSATELADAWLFADAAMNLIITNVGDAPSVSEYKVFAGDFSERWAEVHQATGMVAAQLDTDLTIAFLRLRARALASGRGLVQLAEDVLAGRMRFAPNGDD